MTKFALLCQEDRVGAMQCSAALTCLVLSSVAASMIASCASWHTSSRCWSLWNCTLSSAALAGAGGVPGGREVGGGSEREVRLSHFSLLHTQICSTQQSRKRVILDTKAIPKEQSTHNIISILMTKESSSKVSAARTNLACTQMQTPEHTDMRLGSVSDSPQQDALQKHCSPEQRS